MVISISTIIPRNYLAPKSMAVTSAVSNSRPQYIHLTDHAFLAKAETSDCLINNSANFDGVCAVPPFLRAISQDDGGGSAYWRRVSFPEIQSRSHGVDVIFDIDGLWDNGDGNCPITIAIQP